MKFNRRFLLWSGLGATIAAVFGHEHLTQQALQAEQVKLRQLYDPTQLVESAFGADLTAIQDSIAIQQSAKLRSPYLGSTHRSPHRPLPHFPLTPLPYLPHHPISP
ncbi:hypothetical protein ACN4EK_19760 [Pantanalinema rosaneae CENA516]|uniref:hypothetical protein n=1 Tax=Pantanalinema rosaneae TaxID=1620701 RepID=UPI003D6F29A5